MEKLRKLFSWLKDLCLRGYELFKENRMSVYSGYATLFIVTAVFPCIMLIISIVNLMPGFSAKDVVSILFQILPDLGPIRELIESMVSNLKDQSGGLLASAAAITTLWSASKGVSAIQDGLDEMDDDGKGNEDDGKEVGIKDKLLGIAKDIIKRLVFTLAIVILIPALLVFEILGDSIAEIINNILQSLHPDGSGAGLPNMESIFHISSLVVILFALLVILQIFARLPKKNRTMKSQLPGAIVTGVCWLLFTELFSFFIPRFYHASTVYGSLASLFLLLLWLRFMVMILFAGGVLNHTLEERKQDECE